jgi:hypothetical protein
MDEPRTPPPERKPYSPPSLQVYGDLAKITKSVGANTNKNDKGGGNSKTS